MAPGRIVFRIAMMREQVLGLPRSIRYVGVSCYAGVLIDSDGYR